MSLVSSKQRVHPLQGHYPESNFIQFRDLLRLSGLAIPDPYILLQTLGLVT